MPILYNQSSAFNPYCWDYVHEDGRFGQDHFDEIHVFSKLDKILQKFAAVLGGFCSFLLLYLILFHSKGPLKKYSRMLLLCSICDIVYWIVDTLVMPKSKLNGGCQLVVVEGPLSYFDNYYVDAFGCGMYGSALVLVVSIIPAQYYYRYRSIVDPEPLSVWFTVRLLLASIFVSSISSVLEYYSWSYSGLIQPEFNYGTLWYLEQPLPRIVTKDFNSPYAQRDILYLMFCLVASYAIALYYGYKTYKIMKNNHITESERTKQMQKQLTKTLVIQTVVPLFVSLGPAFLMCFAIAAKQNTGMYSMYLVFFASWIPTLNSLTTIWVIMPFRQITFMRWKNSVNAVTQSSSQNISTDRI